MSIGKLLTKEGYELITDINISLLVKPEYFFELNGINFKYFSLNRIFLIF